MSDALTAAGAAPERTEYATLSMDRAITGLWTQRSPLRDADVPYLYGKFYSASRFDSIIDGINREMTARLTSGRRAGTSVWNSNTFARINSFYSFKYIQSALQVVRTIADCADGNIYDVTANGKTNLFTKSAGAGPAYFAGIGSTLYIADGVDNKKVLRSSQVWKANTVFATNSFIVDTNGNLQLATGAQTANISQVQVVAGRTGGGSPARIVSLFLSPLTPLDIENNIALTISGATTVPTINGTSPYTGEEISPVQVEYFIAGTSPPVTALSTETGTVTTGNGQTGASQPVWNTGIGLATQDGGNQWVCLGPATQNWQLAAPTNAPTVSLTSPPTAQTWAANTWYAPLFVILDSNNNLQQLITAGTTGGSAPTWATSPGTHTTDGSAVWNCLGPSAWVNATVYAVGTCVQAQFTYYITVVQTTYTWNGYANVPTVTTVQQPVTVTCIFECVQGGTSGQNTPTWTNGLGTTVADNTVGWKNVGVASAWPGATQVLSLNAQIVDSNFNLQSPQQVGKSGSSAPTWGTATGASTTDNTETWLNAGPFAPANTGAWIWAYSYGNALDGSISTASPSSAPLVIPANKLATIQGVGSSDRQSTTIYLWRTAQGQNTLILDSFFPDPGPNAPWIFTDTTPDTQLVATLPAPVASSANPPPTGMTSIVFHQGYVFGIVGNIVRWSGGNATVTGNPNTAWPPLNFAQAVETITRTESTVTSRGPTLLLFGTANIYAIFGTGTTGNPFTAPALYLGGVGLASYNALAVVGSTYYLFTGKGKFVSIDPSAGYTEVGFPIGDQFQNVTTGSTAGGVGGAATGALYSPTGTYVAWNENGSGDSGIYVSDGAVGWFRFSPVSSPESGYMWSPRAAILAGTSAVQSVETSTGVTQLLIGPASSGPILFRDITVCTDWTGGAAAPYPSWDVKGSIVLCQSGEVAEIAHVALKSMATGMRPTPSLLLGEITPTTAVPFWPLAKTSEDPPDLPPSQTMYSDRYSALQNGVTPKCDNFQLRIDYGTQAAFDELLKFDIFGAKHAERREQ